MTQLFWWHVWSDLTHMTQLFWWHVWSDLTHSCFDDMYGWPDSQLYWWHVWFDLTHSCFDDMYGLTWLTVVLMTCMVWPDSQEVWNSTWCFFLRKTNKIKYVSMKPKQTDCSCSASLGRMWKYMSSHYGIPQDNPRRNVIVDNHITALKCANNNWMSSNKYFT